VNEPISQTVGDRVLFETETVRVWTLALAPGTQTGVHQHSCDYFYVVVDAGDTETVYPDSGEVHRHTDQRGNVVHVRRDEPHFLRNAGSAHYRNIVVELIAEGLPPT
jgi:predicted metal-dependent enzyme (double-stranded beta helix superfamily)